MSAVTYDMQKLDEAVSALALGTGSIQGRLRDALGPQVILQTGGLANAELSAELDRILLGISSGNVTKLDDDQAGELARAIVNLQSRNWHGAVGALEDKPRAQ